MGVAAGKGATARWGVWTGRFQPFHRGHLALIEQAFATWGLPQWVCIAVSGPCKLPPAVHDRLGERLDRDYASQHMPFSPPERLEMARLSLLSCSRREEVTLTLSPHYTYPGVLETFYPSNSVILLTNKDASDLEKRRVWEAMGYEVWALDIEAVGVLTGTEIRRRVRSGSDLQEYIVPSAWRYFVSIKGPERMMAGETSA